jgi:hypothetical protein
MLFEKKKIENILVKVHTKNEPKKEWLQKPYESKGFDDILFKTAKAINLNYTSMYVSEKLLAAIPESFWSDKELYKRKFLNPFGDSGFLEKLLIHKLLWNELMIKWEPDYGQRLFHILHNMIFSIAKTEASSLWLRKIVYYSADCTIDGKDGNYPAIFHGSLFKSGYDKEKLDSYQKFGNIKSPLVSGVVGKNNLFNYPLLDWMYTTIIDKDGKTKEIKRDPLEYFAILFWDMFTNEKYYTEKELEVLKESVKIKQGDIMDEIKKNLNGYFDVVIGNPPYNTNDEETAAVKDTVYNLFCDAAERLNPKYISFIIPSKWLYGKADSKNMNTKDGFVQNNLNGNQLIYLELLDGKLAFPSVEVGEVCIYTKDLKKLGQSEVLFKTNKIEKKIDIKDLTFKNSQGMSLFKPQDSIIEKVLLKTNKTLESDVGSKIDYKTGIEYGKFGNDIIEDGMGFKKSKKAKLQRPTIDYSLTQDKKYNTKIYLALGKNGKNLHKDGDVGNYEKNKPLHYVWVDGSIIKDYKNRNYNHDVLVVYRTSSISKEKKFKDLLFIVKQGELAPGCIPIGEKINSNKEVENLKKFLSTRFSEYLMSLTTVNQHITSDSFLFIPFMDFNQEWNDEKLNIFFNLDEEEIKRINDFDLNWSKNNKDILEDEEDQENDA